MDLSKKVKWIIVAALIVASICTAVFMLFFSSEDERTSETANRHNQAQKNEISLAGQQGENTPLPVNFREVKTDRWSGKNTGKKLKQLKVKEKAILIHNNGNPISTDIFKGENSGGNYLIAVYCSRYNGVPMQSCYFTTEPNGDKSSLIRRVTEEESRRETFEYAAASADKEIRNFSWEEKSDSVVLSQFDTTLRLTRESDEVTINDKEGSVWNVEVLSELRKEKASRLHFYDTELSAAQKGQTLISYEPTGRKTAQDEPLGFATEDLSSMSKRYGKWKFFNDTGDSLKTNSMIRAANISGPLTLRLSHVINMKKTFGGKRTFKTGTIRIWTADK